MEHQVFISYSSKDTPIADAVCEALERHGLRCWIAHRDVAYGTVFEKEIVDAIKTCGAMVIVFSEHANESEAMLSEIRLAFSNKLCIIPLRIGEAQPSGSLEFYLPGRQWVNVIPAELGRQVPGLVERLREITSRPGAPGLDASTEPPTEHDSEGEAGGGPATAPTPAAPAPPALPREPGERFWQTLLTLLANRRVIPIVGPNAVIVEGELGRRPVQEYLARAAERLLELEPTSPKSGLTLGELARRVEDTGFVQGDLHAAIKFAWDGLEPTLGTLPQALTWLAGISAFSLYATTTLDDLLRRAIDAARHGGAPRTLSIAYSGTRRDDLPAPFAEMEQPAVYHLLGRISAAPNYAVSDEDADEWAESLYSEVRQPTLLIDELRTRPLLLIGLGPSDWLRTFLRVVMPRRLQGLQGSQPRSVFMVDSRLQEDARFTAFLVRQLGVKESIVAGDEAAFIHELVERWQKYRSEHDGSRPVERIRERSAAGATIEVENPWPGLASFYEEDAALFCGRESETDKLLRLVWRGRVSMLYGSSGLGKSSLLQAGLFPRLRSDFYLPVMLRLNHDNADHSLRHQVLDTLARTADHNGITTPAVEPAQGLWEHFHRRGAVYRTADGHPVVPVLAFDQFEEVFTLGRVTHEREVRTAAFLEELSELIENRPPAEVVARLDARQVDVGAFDFGSPSAKVLISLREDFLDELDTLRTRMPSLGSNSMRLTTLRGDAALRVTAAGGDRLVPPEVGERIVRRVAGGGDGDAETPLHALEVEPALLSLFCRELNERRKMLGQDRITDDLLASNLNSILIDFYKHSLADLGSAVRQFVEERLLSVGGHRNYEVLENALSLPGITQEAINALIQRRLVRLEVIHGQTRVELIHDVLTPVVRFSRDRRRLEDSATPPTEPSPVRGGATARSWLKRLR